MITQGTGALVNIILDPILIFGLFGAPRLEAAGAAIAMGNAIETLKERADFVTRTNNEAGIAYAVRQYLNGDDLK